MSDAIKERIDTIHMLIDGVWELETSETFIIKYLFISGGDAIIFLDDLAFRISYEMFINATLPNIRLINKRQNDTQVSEYEIDTLNNLTLILVTEKGKKMVFRKPNP